MAAIWKSARGEQAVHARYRELLALWPGEHEELRVPTREGETFVVASGPKGAPALILLHGSGSTAAMWMGDAPTFAAKFRVYAIDTIGEPGLSAPSRPPLASEAYAMWLDDVLVGLGVEHAALVGVSLGASLALDYAVRRPGRVSHLVLVCPGGVGRAVNILPWALPLMLLGPFGRRRMIDKILGPAKTDDEGMRTVADFMALIFANFRPRMEGLSLVSDAALAGLAMPVLAIVGAQDIMIDSADVKRRIETHVPRGEVWLLPEAGHVIVGQAPAVSAFLGSG